MSKKNIKGIDLVGRFFSDDVPVSADENTEETVVKEDIDESAAKSAKAEIKKGRPPKAVSEKKKNHNIALHPATYDKIVRYANSNHMTISQVLQIAVDKYLDKEL